MSLTLHRSPRVDLLADALAARLAEPSGDPFAPELVVVPAKGVERWLSQRLSHVLGAVDGDGVAANIDFRSPRSLVAELVGAGDDDPWHPDRVVWPLLEVIDVSLGQPWCHALSRHLGATGAPRDERRHGRRWAVAHRIARLFWSYAAQRPAMLARWESGSDTDGSGQPVDTDLTWQPELWRRLVQHVDQQSPATRHAAALTALADGTSSPALPSRLSLFGHTRLSVTEVELIEALAQQRQVDIWLPHPSDALWQALRGHADGTIPRAQDDSHLSAAHPLLATLGRDVRELQRTLAPLSQASVTVDVPVRRPTTLLGRLQSDLEANTAPAGDYEPDPHDRSVQVHACHGAARQVEVLREVILGLLSDDPGLEPRDIVVMCPDIEQFAPLIEASFGLGGIGGGGVVADTEGWHPGQRLQVRLADRSLVQTNPVLGVVQRLLTLSDGRAEVSAVLDLAATDPVRRRFGFSDDDLDEITRWADETGVRWAFDAEHRAPFGLSGYVQNTWRFGLDRVLAGVAVSDDAQRYFGPTLPYDAIGSSDIDLAGRLAEFLDRVRDLADRLSGARPAHVWVETLREAVAALTAVGWGDEWQVHQAERELAAIGADQADSSLDLRLPDVRALMADRLSGRPTRANFRTGSLTVCTMVPMRSVPHRVVCLLGLDDGVFPRAGSIDGDDVLQRRPLTGERDVRSEDRQLLLDAVLAATEHLVITYSGADEITGRPRPPSVPLGELIDTVRATAQDARIVHHHPLQAFDARNFTGDPAFSFDTAARDAALASRGERTEPPPLGDLVLPAVEPDDVDLADLGTFLRAPVREFLRRRLGLKVFDDDAVLDDAMPVELDGLQKWAVGSAMLDDLLRGADPHTALQMAWRRGALPPGRLGWQMARDIAQTAAAIGGKALEVMGDPLATSVDVDLDLGEGRRLSGTITGVHGDRVVNASFSSLSPRHQLDAWLPLLALSAARPDTAWTAGTIARERAGAGMVVFDAVAPEIALRHLRDLVALRDLGLTRPLRLPLKTGYAMAKVGVHGMFGARRAWEGDRFDGERDGDHHPQVWGRQAPFSVLTQAEAGHDLAALAERLWRPVLDAVMR